MDAEYIPTAESILETLAKLLAHQNGGIPENLTITRKKDKEKKPA